MAKKRKLESKSSQAPETVIEEEQFIEEEDPEEIYEEEEEEIEYEEVEEEVEEEEEEEDGEEEEEEDENEEEKEDADGGQGPDGDEGPMQAVLGSFSKEALISLLCDAAERHPDVAEKVRESMETEPSQRKIFVHGLSWDSTKDTLLEEFRKYGEIDDCRLVTDKITGKSKGYGFILFKSSRGARAALKEPQKMINNRMTACQLASLGPVAGSTQQQPSDPSQKKIYVSNVGPELDPVKLKAFFSKYGEIEEGPLGLDKETGKPKGFCLFVYKTAQSAKWALTERYKQFEGVTLKCQKAIDGPKPFKISKNQTQTQPLVKTVAGSTAIPAAVQGNVASPSVQQGLELNPTALGQALTALIAAQGAGFNLFGAGTGLVNNPMVVPGLGSQGGYGNQGAGMVGGISAQENAVGRIGNQAVFPNQRRGRGYAARSKYGGRPYLGR